MSLRTPLSSKMLESRENPYHFPLLLVTFLLLTNKTRTSITDSNFRRNFLRTTSRRHGISPRSEISHLVAFSNRIVRNYLTGGRPGNPRISPLPPPPPPSSVIRFTNLGPDIGAKKTLIARLIAKTVSTASGVSRMTNVIAR